MVQSCLSPLLRQEWEESQRGKVNERCVEYEFALRWLASLGPRTVLDVGSGGSSWPHLLSGCGFHVTAIDEIESYWGGGLSNRHFHVLHDDITKPQLSGQFDFITCISVLEHIPGHEAAVQGMFRLLKPRGYLVLTFPYNEDQYLPNAYALPEAGYGQNAPYVCQVYSRAEIELWLEANDGEVLDQAYYRVFTGALWTQGDRLWPPRQVGQEQPHQLTCILVRKLN